MPRARGKVKFEDLRVGEGSIATRRHKARVAGTIALRHGECLRRLDGEWIDLSRRETVAGFRYGIEGMRVGGIRRIVVPPHLAYGETGAPGVGIPPNAVLICELELLELGDAGWAKPSGAAEAV